MHTVYRWNHHPVIRLLGNIFGSLSNASSVSRQKHGRFLFVLCYLLIWWCYKVILRVINEKGEGKIAEWTQNCSLGHLSKTAECVLSKQASYPESANRVNRVESFSLLQLIRKFLGTLNEEIWELIDPFLLVKLLGEDALVKLLGCREEEEEVIKISANYHTKGTCERLWTDTLHRERKSIKQEWVNFVWIVKPKKREPTNAKKDAKHDIWCRRRVSAQTWH